MEWHVATNKNRLWWNNNWPTTTHITCHLLLMKLSVTFSLLLLCWSRAYMLHRRKFVLPHAVMWCNIYVRMCKCMCVLFGAWYAPLIYFLIYKHYMYRKRVVCVCVCVSVRVFFIASLQQVFNFRLSPANFEGLRNVKWPQVEKSNEAT